MTARAAHLRLGRRGERLACRLLEESGCTILARNWRCRAGELDIVARKQEMLVIAEVKFRSGSGCGDPAEAVDARKQRKICRVALDYLMRHPWYQEKPCRFDVICVYGDGEIRHIEDAFLFQ